MSATTEQPFGRWEIVVTFGPCSQEEAERLLEAITCDDLTEHPEFLDAAIGLHLIGEKPE